MTEASTNKPEIDEDEEEEGEEWKDASPITPICSPARRPPKFHHRDKQSPTRYVDVDNDVEIIHEFYPTTSKTMLEETSIVSYGGTIIVETTRIPRHTKDVAARMEKVTPKVKLKKQEASLEQERVPPVQKEPSSSVEETSKVTARTSQEADQERAKSLKRHSSAESEGRTSTSKETLEKSDTSSEKGAKKKVFTEKEDGKRRSKRSGKRSVKIERGERIEEDSSRRKGPEDEESSRRKDDETYRRSREERKSLKEQECIERVTEFLTRHSVPTYPEMSAGFEAAELSEIADEQSEQRAKRPSISREAETAGPSTTPDASVASTKRRESLKSVLEVVEETKDSPGDSKVAAKDARKPSESKKRPTLERTSAAVSDAQQFEATVQEPPKRPSSLRKKRDSFSRESSRESLLEEKKGVRIQEDVQEIFFEDTSEQVSIDRVCLPAQSLPAGL